LVCEDGGNAGFVADLVDFFADLLDAAMSGPFHLFTELLPACLADATLVLL
jgi:hypothetical protein